MTGTVAVLGAGPGLGVAIARQFGRRGWRAGLVARSSARLTDEASVLRADGVAASAYAADLTDPDQVGAALDAMQIDLGPIDVLAYTPGPGGAAITTASDVSVDSASAQFSLHVLGAVSAVQHVLPAMLTRGTGTVLLTTGASSVIPVPALGNVGIAMAGLRNWALALHHELAPRGVHVATITIATGIRTGDGANDPDAIAAHYVDLHERRDRPEQVIGDLEAVRRLISR
ncbi:SDR family NAD(P)-dependent oxidoreductase [Kribbella sp. NPDC023855]|uniref:SDR family NAD(P)-dependent oxidoreductase n=1 Tax=Kribbella sp. NPDC023855 TaxID=3154698 RepID=UPI0033E4872B